MKRDRVQADFEKRDGRMVLTRLVVEGDPVDSATLRRVPMWRLEAQANLDTELDHVRVEWPNEHPADLQLASQRPRLTRPDGTDPTAFARRVAEAYSEAVMRTHRPALALAEEAGVPVPTARGWIREARRRGTLPPGHKGRAG